MEFLAGEREQATILEIQLQFNIPLASSHYLDDCGDSGTNTLPYSSHGQWESLPPAGR